ncbi:MAG: condensation domain-containing protein, partial [Myxococcota bacterium]
MQRSLVDALHRASPDVDVYNLYGPSEDTTYSTWSLIAKGERSQPTIGRPIAGTQAYLLDARGTPVLRGAVGEIYLGGAGVTRGYHQRPGLTAERFVPDPFSSVPGARMYRTGDLGRHTVNGEIAFLGRTDHQVKVRGHRIELGEIDVALAGHPDVSEAVVIADHDDGGHARIVAYIASHTANAPTVESIREHLHSRLPSYMVPALFVALAELPKTPNGKIDRSALPSPTTARPTLEAAFVAPQPGIETELSELWQQLLRIDRVGRHDNFFALGGHSLLAIQLVSRLRDRLKREVPVRAVFEQSTLASLADHIETHSSDAASALLARTTDGPSPLTRAQQTLWFLYQLEPDSSVYNLPWALKIRGPLDKDALRWSLEELLRRHEALRTRYVEIDRVPHQLVDAPALSLEWRDFEAIPQQQRSDKVADAVREAANRPFDLASGPVFRCVVFCATKDEHILLLSLHHIAADGGSLRILGRALEEGYHRYRAGDLTERTRALSCVDYAHWERGLDEDRLDEDRAYWLERLSDAPAFVDLPGDFARPAIKRFKGAHSRLSLDIETTKAIERVARNAGTTPYVVLLAAFKALLHRWSGQTDMVVGSPMTRRDRTELEDVVGFFVNTLVMRTEVSGPTSLAEIVARVRDTVR